MSRAIDADALIEFIENRYDITWKDDYEGGIKDACVDILEEINKMPTIEPERKTGRWETYVISMLDGEGCKCSECGFEGVPYWDFCPHCGARMEGD